VLRAPKVYNGEYNSTTISGSPAYMPPEQIAGHTLTKKCDVWAVGVCLWELATQRQPWAEFHPQKRVPGGNAGLVFVRDSVQGKSRKLPPAKGADVAGDALPAWNAMVQEATRYSAGSPLAPRPPESRGSAPGPRAPHNPRDPPAASFSSHNIESGS